jgi:signal transduction histidine kinase
MVASGLFDVLFVLLGLSGASLYWLGLFTSRTWDEPGVRSFVSLTYLLGIGGVLSGLSGIIEIHLLSVEVPRVWSLILGGAIFFSAVVWLVFTLEYTGRWTAPSDWWIALLSLPAFTGVVSSVVLVSSGVSLGELPTPSGAVEVLVVLTYTLSFLYIVAIGTVGIFLLLRTTDRYGHLSIGQGAVLSLGILIMLVTGIFGQMLTALIGYVGFLAAFAVGLAAMTITFAFAVHRYDIFESTPAVGNIGKEAVARETDDLVIVTDHRERVIEANERVARLLESDVEVEQELGNPLSEVLGTNIETLRSQETVTFTTSTGNREFDTQVSDLTDQHDRWLGYLISLRDVTRRQIRQQQLSVLNRVLRHNLRNKLTIVKGRVKAEENGPSEAANLDRAVDAADDLIQLSERARTIEKHLQGDGLQTEVDVSEVVRRVVASVGEEHPGIEFAVDFPDSLTIQTDEALIGRIIANAVDNAAEHNESTDPWVRVGLSAREDEDHPLSIEVTDNGPGIPEQEVEAIRQGEETALKHGSGLGMWVVTWGTRFLGGRLSFEDHDSGGTIVRIELPMEPAVDAEDGKRLL